MNSSNNKKKSRFFDRMIKENGKNFLNSVNSEELRRNIGVLFRDVAFGSLDKSKHGQYFYDGRFLDIIVNEAMRLSYEYSMCYQALLLMIQNIPMYSSDSRYVNLVEMYRYKSTAYNIICNGFYTFRNTGNIVILDEIASKCRFCRKWL